MARDLTKLSNRFYIRSWCTESPYDEDNEDDFRVVSEWYILDRDQRRYIVARVFGDELKLDIDSEDYDDEMLQYLYTVVYPAVAKFIDYLPLDVFGFDMRPNGDIMDFLTKDGWDKNSTAVYISKELFQLPAHIGTVLRSDLAELDRFQGPDLVSYVCPVTNQEKLAVFKYYMGISEGQCFWEEIQILSNLPPHPHIIPVDKIVLEEFDGVGVVGFTTPFIANGSLDDNKSRTFKLKWLKQLIQTVDDLNLKFGVSHQDIAARNMLIDPATDNLVLFDFNFSAMIDVVSDWTKKTEKDYTGQRVDRDDVKGVMFALHDIITRTYIDQVYYLHLVDEKDIEPPEKWVKHPDVQLDHPVSEYYDTLMTWVRRRRSGPQVTHYTQATEHITYPACIPILDFYTIEEKIPGCPYPRTHFLGRSHTRSDAALAGVNHVAWERPPTSKIDRSRRLLATGKYADEQRLTVSNPSLASGPRPAGPINAHDNSTSHGQPLAVKARLTPEARSTTGATADLQASAGPGTQNVDAKRAVHLVVPHLVPAGSSATDTHSLGLQPQPKRKRGSLSSEEECATRSPEPQHLPGTREQPSGSPALEESSTKPVRIQPFRAAKAASPGQAGDEKAKQGGAKNKGKGL